MRGAIVVVAESDASEDVFEKEGPRAEEHGERAVDEDAVPAEDPETEALYLQRHTCPPGS